MPEHECHYGGYRTAAGPLKIFEQGGFNGLYARPSRQFLAQALINPQRQI